MSQNKVETVEVEVWLLVDADGDVGLGRDQDEAEENYVDAIGGSGPMRLVKVVLSVPKPQPVVLRGVVPAESSEGAELTIE